MRTAFLATQSRLNELTSIPYIDQDYGDLDFSDQPPFPQGSILIKVAILKSVDIDEDGSRQMCTANVIVRYWIDKQRLDTSNIAPDDMRTRSLDYYDITEAIHNKLQGFSTEEIDRFSRESQVLEDRRDNKMVMRYVYRTSFIQVTGN
ncbi:hypothetical protein AB6735_18670 [Mucilaginibacter sp. RCC_168]|uniref:hypothetical protein n=1 Tax=Mucilaginibacter sp. RCC_168 TaxID=3239221 RepID=UPI003525B5E7